MAQPNFDYEGALDAGYSNDEINSFLTSQKNKAPVYLQPEKVGPEDTFSERAQKGVSNIGKNFKNFFGNLGRPVEEEETEIQASPIDLKLLSEFPNFDVKGAIESGYTPEEVNEFLTTQRPERSMLEKGGRLAGQFAIGAAENALLPYEVSTIPLGSKDAQNAAYRETLGEDLEQLMEKKAFGEWNEKDQELYDHISKQLMDPRESERYVQTADIGVRGLAEKVTGLDLHPEGILEKAAGWAGFLKDPKKGLQFAKDAMSHGTTAKELFKTFMPGTKTLRGLGAGTALEMAQEGQFGPLGTLGAVITGDIIGHGPKGIFKVISQPKKSAAQLVNLVTRSNTKKQAVTQLVEDFNKLGLQMDVGTLTQSPLIQSFQARLSQSGLVGDSLDNFRKELSGQITREYENTLKELGDLSFENSYQASEAIRDALKVNEINLNIPKEQSKSGRSLTGRIAVEEPQDYQRNLLNRIAPQEFESNAQAGLNLQTAAQDIKQPIKEELNQRWSAFNEEIGRVRIGPQAELAEEMSRFVEEHRGSLLLGESAPEARVLGSAENLLERLRTPEGGLRGVTLNELIKTKRTLSDIANWEFYGSNFESSYKKLVGDIDRAIERTLQQANPALMEAYQELNAEYSAFKDAFENKNVKSLFEPKNENYNAIHNEFISNPDKLRSLEDIFYNNPRGQDLINQVKRDYAQRVIESPNVTEREIRNLSRVLGPQFEQELQRFLAQRQHALEHPLPRIVRQEPVSVRPGIQSPENIKPITGRAKETGVVRAAEGVRKKFYEYLSKKSPEQIMKEMDTVGGIKQLRRALELTPEGKELFKDLSRYKMAEMIDNKMKDAVSEQVKLGKFSNLLSTSKNKGIARELLGKEAFERLELLQRSSGHLAQSAEKFFNASKTGSTTIDMGLVGTAATGAMLGNPFMALPALLKIGGSYLLARLFADPVFLKELEKASLTTNPKIFQKALENMRPRVRRALLETYRNSNDIPENSDEQMLLQRA